LSSAALVAEIFPSFSFAVLIGKNISWEVTVVAAA